MQAPSQLPPDRQGYAPPHQTIAASAVEGTPKRPGGCIGHVYRLGAADCRHHPFLGSADLVCIRATVLMSTLAQAVPACMIWASGAAGLPSQNMCRGLHASVAEPGIGCKQQSRFDMDQVTGAAAPAFNDHRETHAVASTASACTVSRFYSRALCVCDLVCSNAQPHVCSSALADAPVQYSRPCCSHTHSHEPVGVWDEAASD
jgi:hypothetical protein